MNYHVVQIAGKQYRVSPGDIIEVDRLEAAEGDIIPLSEILLSVSDSTTTVGTPTILGVSLQAKVIGEVKEDKIRVATFKSKSRYRRTIGHRQKMTRIEILPIGSNAKTATPKTETKPKAEPVKTKSEASTKNVASKPAATAK
jgi:large subunit ribosomal protein L21